MPRRRTAAKKATSPDGKGELGGGRSGRISRSHSLDESQEDPNEHLLDGTEQGRRTGGGITSDEYYQKEMSLAFPFLKNMYSRYSRKSDRHSVGMDFGRNSANSRL